MSESTRRAQSEDRNDRKKPGNPWLVWGIAALFYLYEAILRAAPGVMTEDLMLAYEATSSTLGALVAFYYYAYTLFQLPCGLILDKLGPRRLLTLSAFLCCFGGVLFAISDNINIAKTGRFLVGAGSACAFISCLQIAATNFSAKYFVVLSGATNMMGQIGEFLGGYPVAKSVNFLGWKNTIYLLVLIGGIIGIFIFKLTSKTIARDQKEHSGIPILKSVCILLRNKQIVLSGIVAGLMYLPISAFSEFWAIPFFMAKYNINNEKASIASGVLFIGVAIGSFLMAMFAKYVVKSYTKTLKISSISTALLFILLILSSLNIYASFIIVFTIGFFTGAQVINFTCAKNHSPENLCGTTIALTNCIVMLIGAVFQPLLGLLIDFFWEGQTAATGVRIYTAESYQYAILTLPACLVISYILSLFVKESINLEK